MNDRKPAWYVRVGLALLGAALVSMSLAPLWRGAMFYETYWGGAAFAPFGLMLGGSVLYLSTFGWRRFRTWRQKER